MADADAESDVSKDLEEVKKLQHVDSDDDFDDALPFTEKTWFNICVGIVIVLNAICIGAELEIEGKPVGKPDRMVWYAIQFAFCLLFTLELIARLYFLRVRYFFSPMNVLDFVVVLLAIADTWVFPLLEVDADMSIFAVFRILRILKLLRLIRLVSMLKELWLIVVGLREAMKTLLWVCLLISLALYICGIFLTTQIGHNDEVFDDYFKETKGWDHEYYFGTVPKSMFTLLQVVTLDGWSDDIARHVIKKYPPMSIFFVLFVTFVSYGLLSVVVGVVVESCLSEAQNNDAKLVKQANAERLRVLDHLRTIFLLADEDNSGTITIDEIRKAIKNPEICKRLQMVGFPVLDPNKIFMILDIDRTGSMTIDEFINGIMRLKGDAKSKDLLLVQVGVEQLARRLAMLDEKSFLAQEKIALLDRKTQKMAVQSHEMLADPATIRQIRSS